jgi:ATP-dependent DNA ligase
MIRSRTNRHGTREAFLYAFDPLELDGHDMRDESRRVRPAALNKLRYPAKAWSR